MKQEKKKLCFVVSGIIDNGVTRVLSLLLEEVPRERYEVAVLLTKRMEPSWDWTDRIRLIEGQPENCRGIAGKIRTLFSLHEILKKEGFHTLLALGDYAAMYMLLAGFGIKAEKIISERNDPSREPGKWYYRLLRNLLFSGADGMVCQTRDASRYYEGIIKRRAVIPNPLTAELPIYQGEREKRVINFCRIDRQKNLPLLIDAFAAFRETHRDYVLEIYGKGPLKEEIEAYIREKKLYQVVLLQDFCPDVHERVVKAAMFVSSSDYEGMSNSMLEAMGMGLPVICTDCPIGGAGEVITSGKNGILVPCGDRAALTAAMEQIAENPAYGEALGREALNIRERLEKHSISQKWWDFLET